MTELSRQIFKSAGRASIDVAEALGNLLVAEILDPGNEFYVVSAWTTDVPVVDNSAGAFSTLDPEWEERWIYLSELLVTLMKRNVLVRVKTNDDPHNKAFVERLESRARSCGHGRAVSDPEPSTCSLERDRGRDFRSSGFHEPDVQRTP